MHRLGVISVWIGLLASLVGLVVGFIQMADNTVDATLWLGLVPVGFAMLLLGTVMTQLSRK